MPGYRTLLCTTVSILAAAVLATDALSMEREGGAVGLLTTVPIPGTKANTTGGNMYVFDISFVDQTTQTYYLADRSNAVVDVVDARTNALISQISAKPAFKGFTGNNGTSGPNGVVAGVSVALCDRRQQPRGLDQSAQRQHGGRRVHRRRTGPSCGRTGI